MVQHGHELKLKQRNILVQCGGADEGRSQGGADGGRSQEQEEPGGTQTTARKAAHGGADGGRSHNEGRADDSRVQLMEVKPVVREPRESFKREL